MAEKDVTEQLSERFPRSLERVKPGSNAVYVSAQHYIDRLNAVLGAGTWSWEATWALHGDVVVVDGYLSALGQRYHGVDGHTLRTRKGTDDLLPDALADAIKGAESGAIQRAARCLGVGLYLWESGGSGRLESEIEPAPEMATKKQVAAITEQLRILGWTRGQWRERYDCASPSGLSKERAEGVLGELTELAVRAGQLRDRAVAVASQLGLGVLEATPAQLISAEPALLELEQKAGA